MSHEGRRPSEYRMRDLRLTWDGRTSPPGQMNVAERRRLGWYAANEAARAPPRE